MALERTKKDIELHLQDTVKIEMLQSVVNRLKVEHILTICGLPGEGKTTFGYMILQEYMRRGWYVYAVKTPEEYYLIHNLEKSVLLFNDIFGSFLFDQNEFGKWLQVIDDIYKVLDTPFNNGTLTIIILRDYILEKARTQLEKFTSTVFTETKVLNISTDLTLNPSDKMKIFKMHQEKFSSEKLLSDQEIERLICSAFPFGFAHCCQLFFSLDRGDPFNFFQNPRFFLQTAIGVHFENDVYKRAVFYLLIHGEGHFDMSKLFFIECLTAEQREVINVLQGIVQAPHQLPNDHFDFHFAKLQEALESLMGLFLTKQNQTVYFIHASIYEAVLNIICKQNIKFIIDHCSFSYLDHFIQFKEEGVLHSCLKVQLPKESMLLLVNRFILEVKRRKFQQVLCHSLFTTTEGVELFLSGTDLKILLQMHDVTTRKSFCYLASSNGDIKLLSQIMKTSMLNTKFILDALYGCCEYGNKEGLILVQAVMKRHDLLYDIRSAEIAFELAIENDHSVIVQALLSDINLQHNFLFEFNRVFIKAAARGMDKIVKLLLDIGVVVNTPDEKGMTALHYSCQQGKKDLVNILVNRGSEINTPARNGDTPLHLAVKVSNIYLIRRLRQLGASVKALTAEGETLLHTAVSSGNLNVVQEVLSYGIETAQKTVRNGETVLHVAARLNLCHIAQLLLLNNKNLLHSKDNMHNSPLHVAVENEFISMVQIILSSMNSIDRIFILDSKNKNEHSPLHIASLKGSEEVVLLLLDNGHAIDTMGQQGITPLCIALHRCHKNICHILLRHNANVNHACHRGSRPLHLAVVAKSDYNTVIHLIQKGASINMTNDDHVTPLCLAVKCNNTDIVPLLLSLQADVNFVDKKGYSALHYATIQDDLLIVKQFLGASCLVDQPDARGYTPLMIAAKNGSVKLITAFTEAGAMLECRTKAFETSLHLAARNGHTRAAEILLLAGADVNTQNKYGSNPLYESSSNNHVQLVEMLIAHGANVNIECIDKRNPLHAACDLGNKRVVQILLEHDADVNLSDERGWASYHFASQHGHTDIVNHLLRKGGNCNAQTVEGLTCMHLAYSNGRQDLAESLLQLGCRVDLVMNTGENVLHFAAMVDQKSLLFLLALGIDVDSRTTTGDTPLHISTNIGNVKSTRELLDRGANINAETCTQVTPLHIAIVKGHKEITKMLIQRGADLEHETARGTTPMIDACITGHVGIVDLLLKAGANVNHSDKLGLTPLHTASWVGHKNIIVRLLQTNCKRNHRTVYGLLPCEVALFRCNFDIFRTLLMDDMGSIMCNVSLKYILLLWALFKLDHSSSLMEFGHGKNNRR